MTELTKSQYNTLAFFMANGVVTLSSLYGVNERRPMVSELVFLEEQGYIERALTLDGRKAYVLSRKGADQLQDDAPQSEAKPVEPKEEE